MDATSLFVVDASVAGRWYLHSDEFVQQARAVLTDFDSGRIRLFAPSHLWYEVPSLISKALGGGRISREEADEAIESFFSLDVRASRSLTAKRGHG